eukprot:364989-Chlamydomonas_euryale.AAC.12
MSDNAFRQNASRCRLGRAGKAKKRRPCWLGGSLLHGPARFLVVLVSASRWKVPAHMWLCTHCLFSPLFVCPSRCASVALSYVRIPGAQATHSKRIERSQFVQTIDTWLASSCVQLRHEPDLVVAGPPRRLNATTPFASLSRQLAASSSAPSRAQPFAPLAPQSPRARSAKLRDGGGEHYALAKGACERALKLGRAARSTRSTESRPLAPRGGPRAPPPRLSAEHRGALASGAGSERCKRCGVIGAAHDRPHRALRLRALPDPSANTPHRKRAGPCRRVVRGRPRSRSRERRRQDGGFG